MQCNLYHAPATLSVKCRSQISARKLNYHRQQPIITFVFILISKSSNKKKIPAYFNQFR